METPGNAQAFSRRTRSVRQSNSPNAAAPSLLGQALVGVVASMTTMSSRTALLFAVVEKVVAHMIEFARTVGQQAAARML